MTQPMGSVSGEREVVSGLPAILGRRRSRPRLRRSSVRGAGRSFTVTFIAVVILAAFLSPLVHSFTVSIKDPQQLADQNAPLYPASPASFTYQGRDYDVYQVPLPGAGTKDLALVKKGRASSDFVDPS